MRSQIGRPAYRVGKTTADAITSGVLARASATVTAIAVATVLIVLATFSGADAAPQSKSNRIRYEYVPPKDPALQTIHDQMKQSQVLEHLQQLLSRLRGQGRCVRLH